MDWIITFIFYVRRKQLKHTILVVLAIFQDEASKALKSTNHFGWIMLDSDRWTFYLVTPFKLILAIWLKASFIRFPIWNFRNGNECKYCKIEYLYISGRTSSSSTRSNVANNGIRYDSNWNGKFGIKSYSITYQIE